MLCRFLSLVFIAMLAPLAPAEMAPATPPWPNVDEAMSQQI